MPARIQIACEESRPMQRDNCGYIDVEFPVGAIAPDIGGALMAAGWTKDEEGYHCPRHDPAARWLRVRLSTGGIAEPMRGLRIRLRHDPVAELLRELTVDAEIVFDPQRFDVEGDEQCWRAKPVGTDWPEAAT